MQKTKKLLTIGITAIVFVWMLAMMPAPASAATLYVPADYQKIQDAIVAAADGDIIEVDPATYYEKIDFLGKAITVKSTDPDPAATIIDGGGAGTVVTFQGAEGSSSVLDGFTITNGSAVYGGGGMFIFYSSPTVTNCTFTNNSADLYGGGVLVFGGTFTATNCTFSGNSAENGGGVSILYGTFVATNCTFSGNSADYFGGGVDSMETFTATNCIFWGNSATYGFQISGNADVTYSDIEGEYPGKGNIQDDPLFVAPDDGNYHLKEGSPCIDAGDNTAPDLTETDFDGNPRFVDDPFTGDTGQGTAPIVDMGAFEYQVSAPNQPPVADAGGPYLETTSAVLVDIDPDTLNLNSKGRWITAYLQGDADAMVEVTLDGSGSSDLNGDPITYNWTIKDTDGYIVEISDESSPTVTLTVGEYTVELEVNDGMVNTEAPLTTITIQSVDLATVDPIDVLLNGKVWGEWGDFQDPELMVKFDRSEVRAILEPGAEVKMTVTGELNDDDGTTAFEGSDTIRVIDKGNNKEKNKGKK